MEIQTRSEINGLRTFSTVKEALKEAADDLSIWKISFTLGNERVRLIREEGEESWSLSSDSIT